MNMDTIKSRIDDWHDELVHIRRHLHTFPELSFEEYETSKFVQYKLEEWGIPYTPGVAGTGVVGLIEGNDPSSRVVALRADMDALPIQEANEVPYRSKNDGKMHACGHDVHTTCLLGAARVLKEARSEFRGSVKLIFQPGEERTPGGASLMIKDGVLRDPSPVSIIGQHVFPPLPCGSVGFRPGMMMASCDEIDIRVSGKGGHGAVPNSTVDPVAISAQLISALQQLVSRKANPTIPSVLSFGRIYSDGGAYNVIPEAVYLQGTFRTFNEEWRYQAHEELRRMTDGLVRAMGGEAKVNITVGYPYLVNDEELTLRCRDAAMAYLGAEKVEEVPMRLTAEDFSYYTHHTRGCFYRLGTANKARGIESPVHTPTFDIDEDALRPGAGLMAWLALQELRG